MSWLDQGRQYHMWFGHGTAQDRGSQREIDPSVADQSQASRIQALAYGAIAALPASLRAQAQAQYQAGLLPRLSDAMAAWFQGSRLDTVAFASHLFGRSANDPVAELLHGAVIGADLAMNHAEMRDAAAKVADAMVAVGLDRWPRFVSGAQARAHDPVTIAASEQSRRPLNPEGDGIRPVYPLEALLGIGGVGLAGGFGAAARAAGAALLRQARPSRSSPPGSTVTLVADAEAGGTSTNTAVPNNGQSKPDVQSQAPNQSPAPLKPSISRQKQSSHIRGSTQSQNRIKQGKRTSTFDGSPVEAEALTQEAWSKGTQVPKRPSIRDYDFGRRIGTGPNGGGQSVVRVHQDGAGKIHGHPSGQETP